MRLYQGGGQSEREKREIRKKITGEIYMTVCRTVSTSKTGLKWTSSRRNYMTAWRVLCIHISTDYMR